jgi:hypothetical protein
MKAMILAMFASISFVIVAGIIDITHPISRTYDKECIDKGNTMEQKTSTNTFNRYRFDRDNCLIKEENYVTTAGLYMAGILMFVAGAIGYVFMWLRQTDQKHKETIKLAEM